MIDPYDLRVTSYLPQSGHGAGGMTVGLTTSGIIVHHIPTGLGISCDSERSQHANKEKALQMLTSLVLAIESEKQYNTDQEEFQRIASIPNKVMMIKNVREKVGCGLKEAKEAIDLYGDEDLAVFYLLGRT
ncbi:peptide chain release factor 1 [Pseudomonas phage phiPsa381]|uniref:Peptide chain release factor 1 n=1 Tax=Pseudomonas phage phiPsa381 TaxID=1460366 RepID=A0A7G9V2W5_9CAUD|nr:peptide chain release factor 1 [Pseudomonas phage phiPsa381]QNO00621.1 peptide chain release factor 1 [Pseudomonas phage phiPsa381]